MSDQILFYFDYESPNAYLAWVELPRLAARFDARIEPVPVLYAGLLEAHGHVGPGEIPAKAAWMMKNLARKALFLGVELNPPAYIPFNPLLALRATLIPERAEQRHALIDALFRAVWVRGLHVAEPAVVERLAHDVGLDGAAVVANAQRPQIKARLRQQTEEAVSKGVFGVPTMVVGQELFWGYDDFPFLEAFLAGRDPLGSLGVGPPELRAAAARRRFRPKAST